MLRKMMLALPLAGAVALCGTAMSENANAGPFSTVQTGGHTLLQPVQKEILPRGGGGGGRGGGESRGGGRGGGEFRGDRGGRGGGEFRGDRGGRGGGEFRGLRRGDGGGQRNFMRAPRGGDVGRTVERRNWDSGRRGARNLYRGGGNDFRRGRDYRRGDRSRIRRFGRSYYWGPGIQFWSYDGYYYGDCGWLKRRAAITGSRYWWRRYQLCRAW